QRHDHPATVPRTELEGRAAVVEFVLALPAHAVAPLPRRGELPVRETENDLRYPDQVRRQDDAARVAGPPVDIERSVVLRQMRIAGIAEDRFYEIEVRDQRAGREEARFHPL